MSESDFFSEFPNAGPLDISKISTTSIYIGTAGFEDRSLAILEQCKENHIFFEKIIGIKYDPPQENNQSWKFDDLARVVSREGKVNWFKYSRFNPEEFTAGSLGLYDLILDSNRIIVDISGMSKFLIIVLLDELRDFSFDVELVYCEAETYYPTQESYESAIKKKLDAIPPSFLTTNVYEIVTTSRLSSNSMQGYPLLIFAFPTFNYKEMYALLNEITPQYLFEIEGVPREEHNKWRLDAIRKINEKVDKDFCPSIQEIQSRAVSTFDYIATINVLDEYYSKFKYTHKCIISPTGSKMQAFAVFLFKKMHPEVHLIYPVTDRYVDEYTSGYKSIWHIHIEGYSGFIKKLEHYSKRSLDRLGKIIKRIAESQG